MLYLVDNFYYQKVHVLPDWIRLENVDMVCAIFVLLTCLVP